MTTLEQDIIEGETYSDAQAWAAFFAAGFEAGRREGYRLGLSEGHREARERLKGMRGERGLDVEVEADGCPF